MPKISVIIPVYNVESYLKKCIESVLAQTMEDLEIILVDDGSTDGSSSICDEYVNYPNITVIHQENKGVSAARNVGLRIAKGEYIAFLDSDDYVSSDMYEEMYLVAKQNSVDIVYCNYNYVAEKIIPNKDEILPENRKILPSEIRSVISSDDGNKLLWFVWKGLFSKEMLYNNNIWFIEKPITEDTLFNLAALLSAKAIWFINKRFYYYVQTSSSIIRGGYKKQLCLRMNNGYIARKKISKTKSLQNYQNSLYAYSMTHSLVMLISNEKSNPAPLIKRIKILREIRNTELVRETFDNAKVNLIQSRIRWAVILLKYRLYVLLAILLS